MAFRTFEQFLWSLNRATNFCGSWWKWLWELQYWFMETLHPRGSAISKGLSEYELVKDQGQKKETRLESPSSPGEATKPAWEPLMNCLLMKGQRQRARGKGQRDALSNLFGLLKEKVSALSEQGSWTCGAAPFRDHLALISLQLVKLPWGSGPCLC